MSKGKMSLDTFKRIWDNSFKQYRGEIGMYNWGESFLNPDLPGIVRYAKNNSPAKLTLNSHFSFNNDALLTDTITPLEDDLIIISCDGFSQEICEQYRVNVDFDLVMHNTELILRHKNPQTQLMWQYLKFPWNSCDETAAKNYCDNKGIKIYFGKGGINSNFPVLGTPLTDDKSKSRCNFYLNSLSINFDGEVYPCCTYYGPAEYSLGNAAEKSIEWIFSHGKGKEMRDYLTYKSSGNEGMYCKHCMERNAALLETWKIVEQRPKEKLLKVS